MTALFVTAGILLFLAVLLACPVVVQARYREEFHVRVGYLFFHYTVVPRSGTKEEPEAPKERPPKKGRFRRLLKAKGLSGFLEILRQGAEIVSKANREILSRLVLDRVRLEISVTGEDAAKTALTYSYVCGAVGSAAGLILGNVKCRRYHISVTPDFQGENSRVEFDAKAHIGLAFVLYGGFRTLFRILKVAKMWKSINNP
ncbi:MAG: DUF2953 domain-containing protein [Oscillospiraceae bacterium]|jgi:hypothetical protein|nr:DUF2953 domain-containing protein [Oscillospiraceae bacterium]MCI1990812.1 DUF2953 domain-containing protein [Oscillospiraceae bacterium]MCI2035343.1 DUF2953 domain-containing protein [Oscillospiraceae bacterium]